MGAGNPVDGIFEQDPLPLPDARTKQCSGTLPDGRTFWAGCPTGTKSRRSLAIAVNKEDVCVIRVRP